jgi:hypothetical protein
MEALSLRYDNLSPYRAIMPLYWFYEYKQFASKLDASILDRQELKVEAAPLR